MQKLSISELKELGDRITDEERRGIKGALRRAFRLSPRMSARLLESRRELPPALKKDGTPGKRDQIRYVCACCGELFQQKNIAVDHIDPVVPLFLEENSMSPGTLAERIFCHVDNLQVLCNTRLKDLPKGQTSCHYKKSQEENFLRRKWKEYKKEKNILDSWSVFYEAVFEGGKSAQKKIDDIEKNFREEYLVFLAEKEEKLRQKELKKLARTQKKENKKK